MSDDETLSALMRDLLALAPPPPGTAESGAASRRAARAALRRGLGRPPGTVVEMLRYLPRLADVPPYLEAPAFLVAALFANHPVDWPTSAAQPTDAASASRAAVRRNFGASVRHLDRALQAAGQRSQSPVAPEASDASGQEPGTTGRRQPALERRFMALLAADQEDLDHHLRRLVDLLRLHAVPVDWRQLLRDLLAWDAPDRRVQRRWASAYWSSYEAPTPDVAVPATAEPPAA